MAKKTLLFLMLILLTACTAAAQPATTPTIRAPQPDNSSTATILPSARPASSTTTAPLQTSTVSPQPPSSNSPEIPTSTPSTVEPAPSANIIADHTVVNVFEQIPDNAIQAASQLTLLMRNASVGDNIHLGLTCIWGIFPDRRPAACGDYSNPKYDPSNWVFENRGNPGWPGKVEDFITQVSQRSADFQLLSFAVDYVDGLDTGDARPISDPENFKARFIDKIEALEAQHPDKIFIWWTMSLPRLGHDNRQKFNQMLRDYAQENQKILFDIADIESHDPDGNLITDDAGCEIIFKGYTNEARSGHLNELGRERVARAFWWLMARIAGWDGN